MVKSQRPWTAHGISKIPKQYRPSVQQVRHVRGRNELFATTEGTLYRHGLVGLGRSPSRLRIRMIEPRLVGSGPPPATKSPSGYLRASSCAVRHVSPS